MGDGTSRPGQPDSPSALPFPPREGGALVESGGFRVRVKSGKASRLKAQIRVFSALLLGVSQ